MSSPECEVIRDAIRLRMKQLKLTQSEVARRVGWTPQRVWHLLSDDDEFLFSTIAPVLRVLGLSVQVTATDPAETPAEPEAAHA